MPLLTNFICANDRAIEGPAICFAFKYFTFDYTIFFSFAKSHPDPGKEVLVFHNHDAKIILGMIDECKYL